MNRTLKAFVLFCSVGIPMAHSATLVSGVHKNPNTFLLVEKETRIAWFEFEFQTRGLPSASSPPRGWLSGISSGQDLYRRVSWPAAEPDRFDRFSIRWTGTWTPEKASHEVRLRADHRTTLFLGGKEILETGTTVAETTAVLEVSNRPYRLRLDYTHAEGDAFVFLEIRSEKGVWIPWVPNNADPGKRSRWNGTYYLGDRFQTRVFQKEDPKIFWNWGDRGPFNRPEDLPTCSLAWSDRDDHLLGAFASNRDGVLFLKVASARSASQAGIEFDRTTLRLKDGGARDASFRFDEPGQFEDGKIRFAMKAGRPLHFWQLGGTVSNGQQVETILAENRHRYETGRPRLDGWLAKYDGPLCEEGPWWAEMLVRRARYNAPEETSGEWSSQSEKAWLERLSSLRDWARTFRPILESPLADLLASDPRKQAERVFPEGFLSEWSNRSDRTSGKNSRRSSPSGPYPEQAVSWTVRTLEEGLLDLCQAYREFREEVGFESSEGISLRKVSPGERARLSHLPVGNTRFTFDYSTTRLRIENEEGCFLEFQGPVTLHSFSCDDDGVWSTRLAESHPVRFMAGPDDRVLGAVWNEAPLLLSSQQNGTKVGILPKGEGVLRLLPKRGTDPPLPSQSR